MISTKQLTILDFADKELEYDVVVAGGGTAGVVAAIAAARSGAKTLMIEAKGYPGGIITEGGIALHSFFNIWKAFPNVEKKQVVRGIPDEIVRRLMTYNASTGYAELDKGYEYDCVSTVVDTEVYKLVAFEMLFEAGVDTMMSTLVTDAIVENNVVKGVIVENHFGRIVIRAKMFIDSTGYGDLSARAGAEYNDPNDYEAANSFGVGGVDIEVLYKFFDKYDSLASYAYGKLSDGSNHLIRVGGKKKNSGLPQEFLDKANAIGLHLSMTTIHKDYILFIKVNVKIPNSPTDFMSASWAEYELRKRQMKALELLKEYVPGCQNAFIARTCPTLVIRRGRQIICDYDITQEEILAGTYHYDDILRYAFHDEAHMGPQYLIPEGRDYGIPYRALCVKGLENLYAIGMMITSNKSAHMSTRNTVSCMAQGEAAGTAAALCIKNNCNIRNLQFNVLKKKLQVNNVYLGDS